MYQAITNPDYSVCLGVDEVCETSTLVQRLLSEIVENSITVATEEFEEADEDNDELLYRDQTEINFAVVYMPMFSVSILISIMYNFTVYLLVLNFTLPCFTFLNIFLLSALFACILYSEPGYKNAKRIYNFNGVLVIYSYMSFLFCMISLQYLMGLIQLIFFGHMIAQMMVAIIFT